LVQPIHADRIAQSYGIQLHSSYSSSVYGQYDAIASLLASLGARSVRDRLSPSVPASIDFLKRLAGMGITTHATMGSFAQSDLQREKLARVASGLTGVLDSMGGYNEPNSAGRPDNWAQLTVHHQKWLYELGQRLGVTVGSASMHDRVPTLENDYLELGELNAGDYCDVISMHRYPTGKSPSELIEARAAWARAGLGRKPVYTTEGGYFTASSYQGGASPVSEAAQATYAPRHIMEYVSRGMKFWQYELMDDPDGSKANREAHLGMVATDSKDPASWRLKPAFGAVQSLLAATADPGAAFRPAPLSVSVEGPADLRWVAAGKRDGSRFLVMWRDIDVYDSAARKEIAVAPAEVVVTARRTRSLMLDGTLRIVPMGKLA
jgi:hypothetical protein